MSLVGDGDHWEFSDFSTLKCLVHRIDDEYVPLVIDILIELIVVIESHISYAVICDSAIEWF